MLGRADGRPEAIEATRPLATVHICVVHLIRNTMRSVNYKYSFGAINRSTPHRMPMPPAANGRPFKARSWGSNIRGWQWFSTEPEIDSPRYSRSRPSFGRSFTPQTPTLSDRIEPHLN